MRLILASNSRARATMLAASGLRVDVVSPDVHEGTLKREMLASGAGAAVIAEALAERKACSVACGPDDLVIGSDQTLEFEDQLFDKPRDVDEARAQLLRLRGATHTLHTAVALAQGGRVIWRALKSPTLYVRAFSDRFLDGYLEREGDAVLGCVGAYRLEGEGIQLFSRIEGDYFTILGLPLLEVLAALRVQGLPPE